MGIVFCSVIFVGGCHQVYITDDEVHQRIKSGLPPGSTLSQVNDFLKKQNWIGESERWEFENLGTLDNMLTEEEKQKIEWMSQGGIRETEKTLFGGRGIVIGFYYDKEGKLVTYKFYSYRY
jgi:hypothetical protein